MQAIPLSASRTRSLTETARREQIVAATIQTLADVGYQKTSFTQIARRSGLSSTGLISYHFASKLELMGEVVATVVGGIGRYVSERMGSATSPRDALRTYILATTEYIGSHQPEMRALLTVVLSGVFEAGLEANQQAAGAVGEILRSGQMDGEFGAFDVPIMASVIQRAIEGLPVLLSSDPDLDAGHYGRELVATFERATRREG